MTLLYGAVPPAPEQGRETAHRLLAFAVSDAWGWDTLPPMEKRPGGKPVFRDCPEFHFNLSHTAGLCLCALSDDSPVGVDCEMVRPRSAGLPRYVMNDGEFAAFDGTWDAFYRVWTEKESYCKFMGGSIFPPGNIPSPPPVSYRCYSGEGWKAALCGPEPLPESIRWVDERDLPRTY